MDKRPKLKIRLQKLDYVMEWLAVLAVFGMIITPLYFYNHLPEIIPTHFNFSGEPDAYSDKWKIFTLSTIGFALYFLMSIFSWYPHKFNYPVTITPRNAPFQYQNASKMLRVLKLVLGYLFFYAIFGTINTALGKAEGLGKYFIPVLLVSVFGLAIYFIINSIKNK